MGTSCWKKTHYLSGMLVFGTCTAITMKVCDLHSFFLKQDKHTERITGVVFGKHWG